MRYNETFWTIFKHCELWYIFSGSPMNICVIWETECIISYDKKVRKKMASFLPEKKDWDAACLLSSSIKSSFPPDRRLAPLPLQVVKGFNQKKRFWNWHAKMHSVQFLLLAVSKGEAEPSANRNTDTVLLYSKINGADENSLCNRLYA